MGRWAAIPVRSMKHRTRAPLLPARQQQDLWITVSWPPSAVAATPTPPPAQLCFSRIIQYNKIPPVFVVKPQKPDSVHSHRVLWTQGSAGSRPEAPLWLSVSETYQVWPLKIPIPFGNLDQLGILFEMNLFSCSFLCSFSIHFINYWAAVCFKGWIAYLCIVWVMRHLLC